MISNQSVAIAYRCPECGNEIIQSLNIFQLSGNEVSFPCSQCGGSSLSIARSADEKIRLSVPCLVCPHRHPYTLSSASFFSREQFLLSCSFCGLDICFIGTEEKVKEALAKSREEIDALMEPDFEDAGFANESVMREVLFSIEELALSDDISCSCGQPDIKVIIDYDHIDLYCKNCGAHYHIPAKTKFDANDAIELSHIHLEKI